MNQPSSDDPESPGLFTGLDEAREREGRLHLTTSLLIGHEDLRVALERQAPGLTWDKRLVGTLRTHQESQALSRAIEPLFNDIADRKRGLFVEDFLIDTNSIDPRQGFGPNVCDIVDIDMPDRVSWSTEGRSLRADLGHRVRFEGVRCRAFWVSHSNLSLSYHLSFELSYRHDAPHYYALSLLQKVFFPTEDTVSIYKPGEATPLVTSQRDPAPAARPLPHYIQHRFQLDAVDLFTTILSAAATVPARTLDGEGLARILVEREQGNSDTAKPDITVADWNTTCVSVLEDPYFFRLLHPDIHHNLTELDQVEPKPTEDGVLVYNPEVLDRCHADHLAYYFLSGFFQNVIDFLQQDLSEVQDGTDPVYPPPADEAGHFIVYATPASLYEVVSQSRSLNIGRGWIGTCPYLFLVHLMTLHNEDLVRRFEYQVRDLIEHLEHVRLLGTGEEPGWRRRGWHSADTFDRFRRFRLRTFEEVQRHRYFNVLRYDTERAFYESIEEVRGIRQREQYWAEVITGLEHTIDDLREAQQRRIDGRRNRLLAAVAVVGVLQVVFQVIDYFFDKNLAKVEWALGLTTITVVLATVLFWPRRQSGD